MRPTDFEPCSVGAAFALVSLLAPGAVAPPAGRQASEVGLPLVRAFSPQEYDGGRQVFGAAQGPDGVLVFASPDDAALLRYDGERWERLDVGAPVLSVDIDAAGRMWVGCVGTFGTLQATSDGWEFVSPERSGTGEDSKGRQGEPRGGLDSVGVPPSFVKTLCTPHGTYFLAPDRLVLWDGERVSTWRPPEGGAFMDLERLQDDVFVLEGSRGLHVLAGDELLESEALGAERILFDALCADGERLLGVWLNAEGLNWIRTGDERRRTLAVSELQRGPTYLSDVKTTPEGQLIVSSASGILVLDARGRFRAWLDDTVGLPSALAYSLLVDREGVVWATLAYGIARIDPSPAVSCFGVELGLEGAPLALTRYAGWMVCGTVQGLFRLRESGGRTRFERLSAVPPLPVYDLAPTQHGLLVASERGLFVLEGKRYGLLSDETPLALASLPRTAGAEEACVVVGLESLRTLRWQDGNWVFGASLPVAWNTEALAIDEGNLWILSSDHGLFRLPFGPSQADTFGAPQRIPGAWRGLQPTPVGPLAWNHEQLVVLPGEKRGSESAPVAGLDWGAWQQESRWVQSFADEEGKLWLFDRRTLRRLGGDLTTGVGAPEFSWVSPVAFDGVTFDEEASDIAWLDTQQGLLRLELGALRPPFRGSPLLRPLAAGRAGSFGPFSPDTVLASGASVRFEVSAVAFDATETNYRYRLDGLEDEWSAWTPQAQREFARLPGGAYTLHVEARKRDHVLGESRVAFVVRPSWHTTWPAWLGGAFLLGALGIGIQRFRSLRLRRENERLARMVSVRTRDLEAQRARVLEHTAELERVNARLVEESAARAAADHAQREMHERLAVAERFESLGAVAGGIAHDFNNYLTSIQGYAELALDERVDPSQRATYLESVTTVARQAGQLCSGLLSLADGTPVQAAPFDLAETVQGMESLLRTSVKDRGVLRFELRDDLPAVAGDPNHLRRALVNLTINAAEASQERRGAIVIRTGMIECSEAELAAMHGAGERRAGRYVYVEVADEGVGLAPESVRRIFDPFFTTKFVGRGLGLATVFRIMVAHAGAIDVHSKIGCGTTMRLLFPEHTRRLASLGVAPQPRPAPELVGHVLVVDDDEQVRALLSTLCRRLGLQVSSASSGREALTRLSEDPEGFTALVLDRSMPGMDGLEVLARIRRFRGDLPILIVSGNPERIPAGTLDSATTFLAKPFSLPSLAQALARMTAAAASEPRAPEGRRV